MGKEDNITNKTNSIQENLKGGKMSEGQTITIEKATLWKYAFFAVVALFVILLFTGTFSGTGNVINNNPTPPPSPTPTPSPGQAAIKISADDSDPVLGEEDAKITVYEFSDFECPFCERAYTGAVTDLKNSEEFKDGEVNFVYRHFPLNSIHPRAQKAAEAAECANKQGEFWEYHDNLFMNQNALDIASLKAYAGKIGLNQKEFDSCLDGGEAEDKVAKDLRSATDAGGRGTPYFVILNNNNGKTTSVSGAVPYVNIESAIASIK